MLDLKILESPPETKQCSLEITKSHKEATVLIVLLQLASQESVHILLHVLG